MVKHSAQLLRAIVAVVAVGLLALAPVAFSGSAQAVKAPRVTLKASAHTVSPTGRVVLTARTVHGVPGTDVVLQQKKAGSWRSVSGFRHHGGGRLTWSRPPKGELKLRALLEQQGQPLDVSPVVIVRVKAPVKASAHHAAQSSHSCTRTSTGSCIRGGEFCQQAMYGEPGYDAGGRSWVCTGDHTHPHWE